jgi:hypothetical protein
LEETEPVLVIITATYVFPTIIIIIIIIMFDKGVRRVACSLILQVKLVRPSLPRSSYDPLSVWSVMQCLSW